MRAGRHQTIARDEAHLQAVDGIAHTLLLVGVGDGANEEVHGGVIRVEAGHALRGVHVVVALWLTEHPVGVGGLAAPAHTLAQEVAVGALVALERVANDAALCASGKHLVAALALPLHEQVRVLARVALALWPVDVAALAVRRALVADLLAPIEEPAHLALQARFGFAASGAPRDARHAGGQRGVGRVEETVGVALEA